MVGIRPRIGWRGLLELDGGRPASAGQAVYVSAEFTHNEITLRPSRFQMRLMQPLAERHRDTEGLIHREPNVDKVEAINSKVIQEMAARRDGVARNATVPGNDVGDDVEGGRHRTLLVTSLA